MNEYTQEEVSELAQYHFACHYDACEIECVAEFFANDMTLVGIGSCCIMAANDERDAELQAQKIALARLIEMVRAAGWLREKPRLFDFGEALRRLKAGKWVARTGWNGKGMSIRLHAALSATEPSTLPYIVMRTTQGGVVPWLASQTDLLAEDWCEVVAQ